MFARKALMIIALGACILGLSGFGSQKNLVQRPYKARGQVTGVIDLNKGTMEVSGVAYATHLGFVTSYAKGAPNALKGTVTAANGDKLFWESYDPLTVVFTGGTGRFMGATGGYVAVDQQMVPRPNPPPGQMIIDVTFLVEGTITY